MNIVYVFPVLSPAAKDLFLAPREEAIWGNLVVKSLNRSCDNILEVSLWWKLDTDLSLEEADMNYNAFPPTGMKNSLVLYAAVKIGP